MMNITEGSYFGMNAVGKAIWNLLETPRSEQELVERLLEEFEVDEETCRLEVVEFIDSLRKNNLIDLV